jgi:hypothetical protein
MGAANIPIIRQGLRILPRTTTCIYSYINIYVFIYMSLYMYVYIFIYRYVYVHIHIYTNIRIISQGLRILPKTTTCIYVCMYLFKHMYAHIYTMMLNNKDHNMWVTKSISIRNHPERQTYISLEGETTVYIYVYIYVLILVR